jgi:hypothetical protein
MIHRNSFKDGKTQKVSLPQEYIIFVFISRCEMSTKALCDVGVGAVTVTITVTETNIHPE